MAWRFWPDARRPAVWLVGLSFFAPLHAATSSAEATVAVAAALAESPRYIILDFRQTLPSCIKHSD